ncbi:MAG TPA: hypothetical protein VFF73_17365 [Planctomycetota bacterium]|nr:hypothetical protein [Planctomycetota bacterium]
MARALLVVALLSLAPGCVTQRFQESVDLYRWDVVSTDEVKDVVAANVLLGADGQPWAVRLRAVTWKGEIVDYADSKISERGFELPSELHKTGNAPVVVVRSAEASIPLGTRVRRAPREGGELSAWGPLGVSEAKFATILVFTGKSVTVLSPPSEGREIDGGQVSLLRDRGRTLDLEKPKQGGWRKSSYELARYYACLPLTLLIDAAFFPFTITGAILHANGLDQDRPREPCPFFVIPPWKDPEPPIIPLPKPEAAE